MTFAIVKHVFSQVNVPRQPSTVELTLVFRVYLALPVPLSELGLLMHPPRYERGIDMAVQAALNTGTPEQCVQEPAI
jgi:hypothetical protein